MRTHWEKSLPKEIINLNILTRGRFNKIFPFSFPKEIMPKYVICNPTFYSLRMTNVMEMGAPFPPQKKGDCSTQFYIKNLCRKLP